MFAYCGNNPVMLIDPTGNVPCTMIQLDHEIVYDEYYQKVPYQRKCVSYYTEHGYVYIYNGSLVKKGLYENEIVGKYPNNVILVYDARKSNGDNPNMQIWNSYLIEDENMQRAILEVLTQHDKAYPSSHVWGRTVDSMLDEWDAHNDIYQLAKYISYDYANRVAHTDFDYNDKNKTYWQYWKKAIKEALGI